MNLPTRKRKWWTTISQCATMTRGLHNSSLPNHTWHLKKSNLQACLWYMVSQMCVHQNKRPSHHQNKEPTSMRSIKKLHHVRTRKLYLCIIYKNTRQNKYLPVFPCTTFQFSFSKWSRNQHNLIIGWISQNICSLHFYFHRFDGSCGNHLKFLQTLHGEMFTKWSQHRHWYPNSSDANQVC